MPAAEPITAAELPEDWIAVRRLIAQRDGHALRAGTGNGIEVQSIYTGDWLVLPLTDKATQFTTAAERDGVLAQLQQTQLP